MASQSRFLIFTSLCLILALIVSCTRPLPYENQALPIDDIAALDERSEALAEEAIATPPLLVETPTVEVEATEPTTAVESDSPRATETPRPTVIVEATEPEPIEAREETGEEATESEETEAAEESSVTPTADAEEQAEEEPEEGEAGQPQEMEAATAEAEAEPAEEPEATTTDEPTPSPTTETIYVVQPGDTLYNIGQRFDVTWDRIAEANGLVNPNQITVGQALKIPTEAPGPGPTPQFMHTVQSGDTLLRLAVRYGVSWPSIAEANNLTPPYIIYPGQTLIIPGE